MKTLYKKTSTGATQIWRKEIEGAKHRTVSGQINGKQVTSEWTTCTTKNVGKANEISAEKQAIAEVEAAYTKKLAQGGYHESLDDIHTAKFFKPMLAKNYDDYTLSFPVYSQPKLDGIRCIATADGLWTRQGKPIEAVPHISNALAGFFEECPEAILDGELYADKLSDNFNEIISLVRKQNPSAEHFDKTKEVIKYHVYDYPSVSENFFARITSLPPEFSPYIVYVETKLVHDQSMLDQLNAKYIEQGYEGQMVRLNGPYKNGRSADLLKRKEFMDDEFVIISINEGLGNRSGMAGSITYLLSGGTTFDSGIRGSQEFYKKIYEERDQYVSGEGTVRFFNYTPAGVPRFPVTTTLYKGERDL